MARELFELLQSLALFSAAAGAFATWHRLHLKASSKALSWLFIGLGTLYLGTDERLDIHEELGGMLYRDYGLREPPGINHMDDLVMLVVAGIGLAACWLFRHELRDRAVWRLFVLAVGLFAAAVAWDATASTAGWRSWWFEEALELAGGILLAASFANRWRSAGLETSETHSARQSEALRQLSAAEAFSTEAER